MKKYFSSVDPQSEVGVIVSLGLPLLGIILVIIQAARRDWFRMKLFLIWTGIGLVVDGLFALVGHLIH
jgi:hypothetical protein